MRKDRFRLKTLRAIVFLILLTWCLGFSNFFIFKDSPLSIITYPVFKQIYSNVCHQNELKSFNDLGFNLFVCARCTGIYLGCLLISFLSVFMIRRTEIGLSPLYISLLLILTDVLFVRMNIYLYSKLISFITGLVFGLVIYLYFLEIMENSIGKFSVVKNNA